MPWKTHVLTDYNLTEDDLTEDDTILRCGREIDLNLVACNNDNLCELKLRQLKGQFYKHICFEWSGEERD